MSTKESYQKKLRAKLNEWDAEIQKLKSQANQAEADAEIIFHESLDELKKRRKAVEEKLTELQKASESSWKELKAGAEKSWNEMHTAMKKAREKFFSEPVE